MLRHAPAFLLALGTSLPGLVGAQPLFVLHAPLTANGTRVGELHGAPACLDGWDTDRRLAVHYLDRVIDMRATIDLDARDSYVVVGTAKDTVLRGTGPFQIVMTAHAWAPLAGRAPDGVAVLLPAGLPEERAVLRAEDAASVASETPTDAFSMAIPPDRFLPSCGQIPILARPDARARTWTADGDQMRFRTGPRRGAFVQVETYASGFIVTGWVRGGLPTCEGGLGRVSMSTACGDGSSNGAVVTLPAGTALYANASAEHPFARLRAPARGIEPTRESPRRPGAGAAPDALRGPGFWIVHAHRMRGGGWILKAWIRTPAERLTRVREGGGFGGCWSPPSHWPPSAASGERRLRTGSEVAGRMRGPEALPRGPRNER